MTAEDSKKPFEQEIGIKLFMYKFALYKYKTDSKNKFFSEACRKDSELIALLLLSYRQLKEGKRLVFDVDLSERKTNKVISKYGHEINFIRQETINKLIELKCKGKINIGGYEGKGMPEQLSISLPSYGFSTYEFLESYKNPHRNGIHSLGIILSGFLYDDPISIHPSFLKRVRIEKLFQIGQQTRSTIQFKIK